MSCHAVVVLAKLRYFDCDARLMKCVQLQTVYLFKQRLEIASVNNAWIARTVIATLIFATALRLTSRAAPVAPWSRAIAKVCDYEITSAASLTIFIMNSLFNSRDWDLSLQQVHQL